MALFKKHFLFILLFLLLVFLSIAPRSVELLNKNYIFLFDQGRDYMAVKNIVVDHKLTMIGAEIGAGSAGFSYIFHGPGHYYLLALPFLILNGDPYGGIVLMWILSIAGIILGYVLGKKLFENQTFGLFTALIIAASPPLITQARFVWNSYPTTPFIILMFIFTYLIPKKPIFIFLAAFFAGFIYNFELAIAVPLSIALVIYMISVLKNKNWKSYRLLILGFIFAYLPMGLFEIRHGFMGIKNLLTYLASPQKQSSFTYLSNFDNHFQSFTHNLLDTFPKTDSITWIILALIICGGSIFFLYSEKNKNRKNFIIFLLLLPLISFFVFAPLRNSVYPYYLVHLNITYILLFTYILLRTFQNKNKVYFLLTTTIFVIFIANAVTNAIDTWKHDWNDYGNFAKIKGKKDALDYIYQDAKGQKFNLIVFTPPVYTYPYDYLSWWYGKEKYGYEPGREKKGTVYLLIEPDNTKIWSYKGWLETVIKTGKVINTTTLPSGLIIQKREF